jgi:hypothetical protein
LQPSNRKRLKVILQDHNVPQKHVWRAEIVLLSAAGAGTNEVMRRTGKSKPCALRWQEWFMPEGVAGLPGQRSCASGARSGPSGIGASAR